MTRTHQALVALTALVAAGSFLGRPTEATPFPPFTKAEGKPCGYCHVKAEGGGKRNYRGLYYKAHANSFAEFDDAAEAKKAGEEVAPDPDPNTKPKSWTAPKAAAAPAETPAAEPAKAPVVVKKMTVAEAKAKMTAAEKAYNANKKNAARKKSYAAALADLGEATAMDQSIAPRLRYPAALKHYRKALTLDPANKKAAANKKEIEDIYKQMGRPVPK